MKWDGEDKGSGMRIPCMKSNEMYTIQYDANYFGFRRFDVQDYGAGRGDLWEYLLGGFRGFRGST